jgi:myo-inositol catabolism protein IolH
MIVAAAETFVLGHHPLPTALAKLGSAGFDGVEFIIPNRFPIDLDGPPLDQVRNELERTGLAAVAVGGGWPLAAYDEVRRAQGVTDLRAAIGLAVRLGCRTVTSEMNGGESEHEAECIAALHRSIAELIPDLELHDLTLALEPHPGDVIERQQQGLALVGEVGHELIGYLYCMPHTFVLGDDASTMIREAGELLRYVHVADSNRQNKIVVGYRRRGYANALETEEFRGEMTAHEHLLPGKGDLDFDAIQRALKDIGYDGVLSAVPFAVDSDTDLAALQIAMRKLGGYDAERGFSESAYRPASDPLS